MTPIEKTTLVVWALIAVVGLFIVIFTKDDDYD